MNHFSFELSLVAVIPALILCGYVFYKDRIEREPIGLLALLFGAGFVGYIPAFFIKNLAVKGIDLIFKKYMSFGAGGTVTYASETIKVLHLSLVAFAGIALVQICVKWLLLFFITGRNKNFNYLFDGIVYATFLSLGFAIAENIHFAFENDVQMLGAKLLTSVPCHLFIGILMGYYYTMWHLRFTANKIENRMIRSQVVKEDKVRSSAIWLVASFVIPLAVNGIYLLAGSIKNETLTFVFYFAVLTLYGISFLVIDRMASKDCKTESYLCRIIAKGHTDLEIDKIKEIVSQNEEGEDAR
jgi:RsiW-degrading membrane proteinase PrsW (M82 family)